jgi:hypothetical protein
MRKRKDITFHAIAGEKMRAGHAVIVVDGTAKLISGENYDRDGVRAFALESGSIGDKIMFSERLSLNLSGATPAQPYYLKQS